MNPQTSTPLSANTPEAVIPAPPVSPPPDGTDKLEQILPQLCELAKKVGGFDKLIEIVRQLDSKGQ